MTESEKSLPAEVVAFVEAGAAIILLKPKTKRPVEEDWTTLKVYTEAELLAKYRPGMNFGVRLGKPSMIDEMYLQVLDVDVREPGTKDAAFARLKSLLPNYEHFPMVASGSGGASRHIYFLSPVPFKGEAARQLGREVREDRQGWQDPHPLDLGDRAVRHRQASCHAAVDPPGYRQAVYLGEEIRLRSPRILPGQRREDCLVAGPR